MAASAASATENAVRPGWPAQVAREAGVALCRPPAKQPLKECDDDAEIEAGDLLDVASFLRGRTSAAHRSHDLPADGLDWTRLRLTQTEKGGLR